VISVQPIVLSLESSQIRRNHNGLKSLSFFFSPALKRHLDNSWETPMCEDAEFYRAAMKASKAFGGATLRRSCANDGPTRDLIMWLLSGRPIGAAERRTLAGLLSGEMNLVGRSPTKAAIRQVDRELIRDARHVRVELRDTGMKAVDAEWEAAERAARDPRSRGRSPSTLRGEMQRTPAPPV
jgi:hypothetical protein